MGTRKARRLAKRDLLIAEGGNVTKVISCVNLKGGVGKTALAVNFAAYCGGQGKRTLLVDLDPQTNATFSCIKPELWESHSNKHGSVADILGVRNHVRSDTEEVDPQKVVIRNVFENVDLIPSHLDLFTIDLDIGGAVAREGLLSRALEDVIKEYDVVVCDCPPNLTLPTQNALAMSTHFVVPVSPDFLSSLGIALLLRRISKLGRDLRVELKNAGILLSRVGRRSYFREQTTQSIREAFGDDVLETEITERSVVAEAAARNVPIFSMGNAQATAEFQSAGREIMERVMKP
ncbi:ParA family protein [Sulfitobacter sp. Ks41]|uniref:ParA family protein n=1 Tax=Sulfitobacter sp. Ks41 TaxID=2731139 RepID=UPI0023E243B9|nr:ParA family protein [Sulfitobacter sp. Ks41]MDF3363194.1 ParA family protein [Sulfitobacter sp. Ks41]